MDGSLAKTTGVRMVTAAVAVAPLRTELRQLPVPAVGPEDGLLAVDACGLCGTDWDFYTRQRGAHLGPLILGHEIVGRVAALGRSEEHTSELQSPCNLVCRLLLEKKKQGKIGVHKRGSVPCTCIL